MTTNVDLVAQLLSDYQQKGWDAKPFEKMFSIAFSHPDQLTRLVQLGMTEIPKGSTFLDAALSFVPMEELPILARDAVTVLSQARNNKMAQDVIAAISLQQPSVLHPYLQAIFELAPNYGTYYEEWPWRKSRFTHFDFLSRIIEDSTQPVAVRQKAWQCLLETREPELLQYTALHTDEVELHHLSSAYFYWVGYEQHDNHFRQLYSQSTFHIIFPDGYFPDAERPVWVERKYHPTWQLQTPRTTQIEFGGVNKATCLVCGESLHHVISLDPVPAGLGISELTRLVLATCLSCLGWEQSELFYQHDRSGQPENVGYIGVPHPPQFPVGPLQPTQVSLAETPARWRWQDWAVSSGPQNLNRVGGYPCWIQDAQFLICPSCNQTMVFLMQLDSELPMADGGEWLWGSGGLGYILWCDHCKISGFLWQDT